MKASLRLATTVPASLTGAAAALRYVRERYDVGQYPMYEENGYRHVRSALLQVPPIRTVLGDQQ